MKIPSWPAWFPYPISCLKGFVLSYTFTSTVRAQFPIQSADSLPPILIGGWIWVALLFSFFHWIFTSGANILLTHLPQKPSLDNARQHLSNWSSTKQPHWREGIKAVVISFVTSILITVAVFSVIPAPSRQDAYSNNSHEFRQFMIHVRFFLIPIGMTIFSAYLYQCEFWLRRRRAAKQERRSQAPTPQAPEPVQRRIKPVKQAVPEVADWYVFRSGKAEGPYTALQLWEIQKITDRTKVRRGEADWQRAGGIPELAKYLTKK